MNSAKLVKKFLLPCGLCAVPFIEQKKGQNMSMDSQKKLIRPSELALYAKEEQPPPQTTGEELSEPSYLEQGFGTVRKSIMEVINQASEYTGSVTHVIDTGLAHSRETLNYLQEESNILPKMGAVGIGGLTGFIFALRGGKFKKIFFTTTGIVTIAGICHPRQAQQSLDLANHYANILYNFVYGVKPGDEKKVTMQWPEISKFKLPSSFSEISDLAVNAGNAVVGSITSLTSKTTETVTEQKESKSTPEETKKSK